MKRAWIMAAGLCLVACSAKGQVQLLTGGPQPIMFTVGLGQTSMPVSAITIGARASDGTYVAVHYRYSGATLSGSPMPPNFLVISPSADTTSATSNPAVVLVGLNQSVLNGMRPGRYGFRIDFSTVDQSPPAQGFATGGLVLGAPFPLKMTAILNAASLRPFVSPGAIISVFGSNLAPALGSLAYDDTGSYPATLGDGTPSGDTTLTFGGIPARLAYVSPTQINAIVPYGIAGTNIVDVVLNRFDQSTALTIPIQDTSPGIFTATQDGSGQGAILNYTAAGYTFNSADNPAAKGSALVMYATGMGGWNPAVLDGSISLSVSSLTVPPAPLLCGSQCNVLANSISLTIGGKPAKIIYAGASAYEPWGLLQINAYVPTDVDSGQQPVVLTIGQNDNSQQKVMIAVK